ncbi:MAG: hypothetical protein ACE5DX_02335 [Candidatus Dojkabacteria bacterium]
MKIYVSHSSNFDYKVELYAPIRESELNKVHRFTLPHEDSDEQYDSRTEMPEFGMVLAEVSFPSTGQGIELGWADSETIPIVCIYKTGAKISGALEVISDVFIDYDDSQDMIIKFTDFLAQDTI